MTLQEKKSKMITIIQNWQESGLSQVEFAHSHNIKISTFRYWISRYRQTTDDQPAFLQVNGFPDQAIHIRYPHGVELVLPAQIQAGLLKSLIHI
jgi:hypothetical protein